MADGDGRLTIWHSVIRHQGAKFSRGCPWSMRDLKEAAAWSFPLGPADRGGFSMTGRNKWYGNQQTKPRPFGSALGDHLTKPAIGGGHQDIFERNRDCGLRSVSFQLMLRADGRHRGQNGHSCLFFGKHGLVEHPDRRTSFEATGRQSAVSRPPCEAIGRVFEIGFFASLYVSLRETHASNDALEYQLRVELGLSGKVGRDRRARRFG